MNPQQHNNHQQKPQSQPNPTGQHQVHQSVHQPHQPHQPFTQNHTSPIHQGMQPPPQPPQQQQQQQQTQPQLPQQLPLQYFPRQNLVDRSIPNYNVPHQFYQNNGSPSSLPFPSGSFNTASSAQTSRPSVDSSMDQQLEPGASSTFSYNFYWSEFNITS